MTTSRQSFGDRTLEHLDALYNHGRRLMGNDRDAEDLVQETYVRALSGAQTFHEGNLNGGSLKAWLFAILRNAFIDLHRRRGRFQTTLCELDLVADGREADLFRDDVELDRLRRLVGDEISLALGNLSEEARAIILLDAEGFTETEVAEVLGCPLGTVKSRLSRARGLLREKLKEYAR